jgi:hypothetical protein
MPVEIARWRTRCCTCGDVYGDDHDTEEEARERDGDCGGQCDDCSLTWNLARASGDDQ